MPLTALLARLRGGLVVSCQAYPGEPTRHPETMAQVAQSAVRGGAVGLRAQGLADIAVIRERVDVPLIGIWKVGDEGVFITPTMRHAHAVLAAGADVVTIDGTGRPRPDRLTLTETLQGLHEELGAVVMADCDSYDAAMSAAEAGADLIGTTLAGYTGARPRTDGPDVVLLEALVHALPGVPIIAEGRIHTPAQARTAHDLGAFAVVVGTAITHPSTITRWFADALA